MTKLKICLFGRFSIQRDDTYLTQPDSFKVKEFFCYLLLHRNRSHTREALANLLWGESTTAQSKKYLRQALWQLQTALERRDESAAEPFLQVEPGWIRLNLQPDIWLDVDVFERAFARVRCRPGDGPDAEKVKILRDAVQLYQGDLLEGCYHDWCLYERERLQNMYLVMLDKLTGFCEVERDFEMGLNYAASILRYDRARECTHRRLMRLYYLAGDRTSALRQYERCVTALHEELGVRPAKLTVELYEQIRRDNLTGPLTPAAQAQSVYAPEVETSLPDAVQRLKELHLLLTEIQRQVQQEIKTVELVFNRRQ
jgi:DNA-binding SARP family transcriptional activator